MNRVAAAIRGFRDPVGLVVGAGRRGGDLAELTGGRSPTFVVTSPDLAREVLEQQADVFLKGAGSKGLARVLGEGLQVSEGEHHRRERALLDPVFAPERLLPYADTVNRALARAPWDDGRILDVVPEMRAITTAAVLRAMFADATDADVDRLTGAITDLAAGLWHAVVPASASLERTPLPGFRRFRRARETLDGYIEGAIAGRRADRGPPADLLAAMLAAGAPGEGMSDGDARDEVISLLLAGRGTITAALAWTWFLLARHPEVERRLHDELDGALGDRPPEAADVERLGYTRAVWDEALRVYPPAWVLRRKAVRDARLGRRVIPAGSTVLVSVFGIHHDPRFHRDPETFDPARFQGGAGPAPFTYLPFGGGPRGCIGFHFATMEAVLLIAGIASRWRLKLADADWRPEFARSITLRPKRPLRMRLVRR